MRESAAASCFVGIIGVCRGLFVPSGGILLPCQKYARAAKGPCPLESRPRGDTPCAVERSNENARSPLDFVSGYGTASTPFRARPTRGFFRRALVGTLERGIETGYASTAAANEPVVSRPQLSCQSSAQFCTVYPCRRGFPKGERLGSILSPISWRIKK